MLDDMEQWAQENRKERNNSRNIFFNETLQEDFYNTALCDLDDLKDEWINWRPSKSKPDKNNTILDYKTGQTTISILLNWIKSDYNFSLFRTFCWFNTFDAIWNNVGNIDGFVACQRQKLKDFLELYTKNGI